MVRFEPADDAERELAPVVYLPGAAPGMKRRSPLEGRLRPAEEPGDDAVDAAEAREQAEKLLLTRLRRRSISVAEAHAALGETGLDAGDADELVERFVALGYLDDARLADQVVHSHHDRKGLGRSGVEAEMRRRKLPAEVIVQALEEIPDDEEERAAELARTRAAQLSRYDDETIERRLTGYLLRKGYGSSVVRAAVRQAVQSARRPHRPGTSTVRFR